MADNRLCKSSRNDATFVCMEEIDVFLPWGFRLAEIPIEVHVSYGAHDTWVERRHIDFLVETLLNARLNVWPDSGHGPARHWREVVEAVNARWNLRRPNARRAGPVSDCFD